MENKCIVLADKHQNILEGLRGLLETVFGSMVMVADQASLLEALDRIKPEIAIVDLSLLKHGNLSTACGISKRFPDVKFIVLSDYDDPEVVHDVMSAGVSAFVLKQYAGADLFDAIESLHKGQTFVSPAIKNKHNSPEKNERRLIRQKYQCIQLLFFCW
jgi:DNA-binding NarL/FixJ family response regulator